MTEYKEIDDSVVKDFAQRTLDNLLFIESNKKQRNVYEVTQLINSMLGLLVFPKEEFWDTISPIPLSEIPSIQKLVIRRDTYEEPCDDLKILIRHIRNSVSHFSLEFRNDKNYISGIEMRDEYKGQEWRAEISIFDLRDFVVWFVKKIIDGSVMKSS
jgi:hypothetical protein